MFRRLRNLSKVPSLGRIETQGTLSMKFILVHPGYLTASHRFYTIEDILTSFRTLTRLFRVKTTKTLLSWLSFLWGNLGDRGHQCSRNLHHNQRDRVCDWLWLREAPGLQPQDSYRVLGGGPSVPGISQPASRTWWPQPLREMLPPLYR